MEKLKKDLFNDPDIDARHGKTAGQAVGCPIGTSISGGGTIARTNPPACNDRIHDTGS